MAAESLIHWPVAMSGILNVTVWGEASQAQKTMNASTEKFGMLVAFDGSELDYIEIALDAGTQADTITMKIQQPDVLNQDTANVTGLPNGTAIANSTVSVSNKGASNEVVRWTFGVTGPSPVGPHWIVIEPSSSGAFSIELRYFADWGGKHRAGAGANIELERLYDGSDWFNAVTVGTSMLRIKKKDGTFLDSAARAYCPFTNIDQTINNRGKSGTNVQGVKFTAPFDMELEGAITAFSTVAPYMLIEAVLVDDSDTELARAICNGYHLGGAYSIEWSFGSPASLIQGSTYRLYFKNYFEDTDTFNLLTVTISAGEEATAGLSSGEFIYTTATDPPAEGGAGSWTDTTLDLPLICLTARQNPHDLASGGGGGGMRLVGPGGMVSPI